MLNAVWIVYLQRAAVNSQVVIIYSENNINFKNKQRFLINFIATIHRRVGNEGRQSALLYYVKNTIRYEDNGFNIFFMQL